jgi:hypothetical protein
VHETLATYVLSPPPSLPLPPLPPPPPPIHFISCSDIIKVVKNLERKKAPGGDAALNKNVHMYPG